MLFKPNTKAGHITKILYQPLKSLFHFLKNGTKWNRPKIINIL